MTHEICTSCGKRVPAWNYCAFCGTGLDAESQAEVSREWEWSDSGPHIGAVGATGDLDDYVDLGDVIGE